MIARHVFTREHISLSLRGLTKATISQDMIHQDWFLELFHGSLATCFYYQKDEAGCRAAFVAVTTYMQEESADAAP
jgi:hypothetical protein